MYYTEKQIVEILKNSFDLILDITKKENPTNLQKVKEMLIQNDIKNHEKLTEKSKNELIEFINNLQRNRRVCC